MANFNANSVKAQIVQAVIKKLEKDREALRANIESTMQAARDAPGRMESRYDSTKAEKSFLAGSLQEHLIKIGRLSSTHFLDTLSHRDCLVVND